MSEDQVREIKQEMFGLTGRAARQKASYLAEMMGVDVSRIYWYSRDVRPGRKARADKGVLRSVNESDLEKLLVFTVQHDFAAPHLAEIAKENGVNIHPATYNRILRERRLSRRENKQDLRPYRRWEAEHPNDLHQIDSTVSQQFYLADDGGVGYEAPHERYKNKPGNKKPRLVLIQVLDDHSRVKCARFTLGNHYMAWMNTLHYAWRKKENRSFPFYGLPRVLYSDNDSVIKSRRFTKAMARLGVEIKTHEVGESRAKGKVEGGFKMLQEFEKVTKIKKWKSLDEANAALEDFLIWYNSRKHGSTGERPFARWLRIDPARLINTPREELFNLLHLDFTQRKIYPDLHIYMFGKEFQLPRREPFINWIGKKVEVCWYPRETERIFVVIDDKDYEIEYRQVDIHAAGTYKHVMKPANIALKEKIEEMDTPDWRLTGFYTEKYGQMWLPKEGREFDESRITGERKGVMRTQAWFIARLQERMLFEVPVTAEEKNWTTGIFGGRDEAPERELLDAIDKLAANPGLIAHKNVG